MKILQVSHSFYPCYQAGGVVKVVYDISKEMVRNDHAVTVFTTDGCRDRLDVQTDVPVNVDGIRVYYFRNISNWLRIKFKIATPLALIGVIKKEIRNFDVIHIHEHRTLLAATVSYYARKNDIPYIVQSHGSVLPFFQKQLLKKIFDAMLGDRILHGASKLIALTESEAEQYRNMGIHSSKIDIIPNGIDLTQSENLPPRGTFRSRYQIPQNDKIILFLGRIHKIKGIDLLLEAYAQLLQEMPDIRLVIVGPDDNFLSILQKQIQELNLVKNPLFTGPLQNQDKFAAYVDADVYVLPSRYEIFGNTILEAWGCGTPVIVTDGCQIADIVKKGGLVSRFDSNDLKEKLKAVLTDNNVRNELGSAGKNLVNDQYNLISIVKKYELVYSDLTSRCDNIGR